MRQIDRGRLVAALDRAAARKVTIISAPAGGGKTTLLHAWADARNRPGHLALLQVRRGQQDAQQFWLALLDAVSHAAGAEPPAATPDFDPAAMADRVRSVLAGAPAGITLIIDDLHELTSAGALAQLARLLMDLPPDVHAILTTRHDLRLGLHQLRLAGELAEIRAADLGFTERETRDLLAASGITLSEAGVTLLHQRTEGWAAGLRLAALSLTSHPDPDRFVAEFSGSNRTVAEYLIAEMLERQSPDVQDLLLRTSLLNRVNGELASLLTGRPGAERILLDLEDANAFVVSLDPGRTWFRYHHLFADLLRLELRRALPGQVPGLHRRAAGWLIRHGEVADAIRHTQAAGDWPEAAGLLADHSFGLMLDGQAQTMLALVRAFPPGGDYPELALVRAGGDLVQGRLDLAAAHLAIAGTYAETAPPERQHRLRAAVASLRLSLATRRADLAGVVEEARFLAAPVTGQSSEDIALGNDLRAVALMNLGTAETYLGLAGAERHLREGAALAGQIGRPYLEVRCLAQLGFASPVLPLATIARRCREAIDLAGRHGWGEEPWIAPALIALAGTMVWTGEFTETGRWLRQTGRALQTDTGADIRLLVHMAGGMAQAGRGRHDEALREFRAAENLGSQLADSHALACRVTAWLLASQARLGLTGEARALLATLDDKRASSAEVGNARAVIALADGDPAAALAEVSAVLDGTAPVIAPPRCVGYGTLVEAHLLAGLAHCALGDRRAAHQAAERALALAEPDRLVLPFAMTGAAELLEALPGHETAHAALVADILDVLRGSSSAVGVQPRPDAERLSPGEFRVLRYLATNLSRPEIADELSISVNTVSTRVRSIYAKLQVRNRTAAVQRARDLRLLGSGSEGGGEELAGSV